MKKTLAILFSFFACVCCVKPATSITIPGSQFPIVTTPSNDMRFLMVYPKGGLDPNPLKGSNATIAYSDLSNDLAIAIGGGQPLGTLTNISQSVVQLTNNNDVIPRINNVSNILANLSGGFHVLIPSNATTAQIQSTLNSVVNGAVVEFQPGVYNITSQLLITNPMVVLGNGATLSYGAGLTNFMVDTGTNYSKPLLIDSLIFDGGTSTNFASSSFTTSFNGVYDPYFNANWKNRSGLRVEASAGVTIQNCLFKGWDGSGCLAVQLGGSFTSQRTPKFEFLFNRCYTNFIGLFVVSAQNDVPGYNNADSSLWRSGYGAEYALVEGNDCFQNQFGIIAQAGNALVQGNTINANYFGIAGTSGDNDQHGRWCGNTINHNVVAVYSESSYPSGTSMIQDNVMLADTSVVFNGAYSVPFKDNWIGNPSIIFTNGSSGVFRDNVFQAGDKWGVDVLTNINTGVLVTGNHDATGTNTDGSMISILAHGGANSAFAGGFVYTQDGSNTSWTINGGGLTNLNGANVQVGTLPKTAADSSWPPATNYIAITNVNVGLVNQRPVATGNTNQFGSPTITWSYIAPLPASGRTNVVLILSDGSTTTNDASNFGSGGSVPNGLVTNNAPANVVVTNAGVNTTITSNSVTSGTFTATAGTVSVIPTNAAPITLLVNASGSSLPLGITNICAGRAEPILTYYIIDATGGVPIMTLSNETTGVKLMVSRASLAGLTETNTMILPVTTTNVIWRVRDESTGSGASVGVVTNWEIGL